MSADTDMVKLKACPFCSNGFHAPPDTRAALDASGIGDMVEALQKCRDKFAEYVELHAVKLQGAQPTYAVKEIEAKVARNQAMVDLCDAALSRARAAVGNKDG